MSTGAREAARAVLSASPLFSALSPARLGQLVALARFREHDVGETVFREGEDADAVYAVLTGLVQAVTSGEDGSEIVVREIGPGEVLGELAVLHRGVRSASIVCVSQTSLLRIGRREFLELIDSDRALSRELLAVLARKVAEATAQLADLAFRSLVMRLARKLLELAEGAQVADRPGREVELRTSQQELARRLGCSRESVNKHLRDLEMRGWIRLGRGRIAILDPAALGRFGGTPTL